MSNVVIGHFSYHREINLSDLRLHKIVWWASFLLRGELKRTKT